MRELADLVDLERFTGLTTIEIAAAKTDLHMSTCREQIWQCEMCADFLRAIRRVLAAIQPTIEQDQLADLAAAGRLLPEGAEHRTELRLTWYFADGPRLSWGVPEELAEDIPAALAHLREAATQPPEGALRGLIRSKEHYAAPWLVVEPVAIEGMASE